VKSLREILGLDVIDLLIHAGVTATLLGFVGVSHGPEELFPLVVGLSLVVLGIRRSIALRLAERRGISSGEMATERIAELEQRMAELEAAQGRVAELEERLDFAERMMARSPLDARQLGPGQSE
jgi:hypothetical protein